MLLEHQVFPRVNYLREVQQQHFAMIKKLVTVASVTMLLIACQSPDIRESHLITDMSKPVTLTFKLKSGTANAGFKIKGHMNGTLGYSRGTLLKGTKFPPYGNANNLVDLDSATFRKYVFVSSDSITDESTLSIGQKNLTLALHFIPGTETKGKIEVEFWEHPSVF
jgi:hypothetical protein